MKLNKETFLQLQLKSKQFIFQLPRWLLVDHLRLISILLFFISFLIALYFVVILFFAEPEVKESEVSFEQALKVNVIDELEFWIEERDREGQQPILNLERRYFRP